MTLTEKDEEGKLFVGGLSWETTQEKLCEYFGRYGDVVDSVVMKNLATGQSRGFGFVTFSDPSMLQQVLSAGPHKLDGKIIDPKPCTPRNQQRARGDNSGKLFLGGLPPDITETELRQSFSKFGKVTEVNIMYDQEKRKCRGFGFLSFESDDATHQACLEHYVEVNGKQIECKLAVPRESSRRGGFNQSRGGGRGRGGGGSSWNRSGPPPQQQSWTPMPPMQAAAPPVAASYGNWGAVAVPPTQQPQQQAYAPNGAAAGGYATGYQGYSAAPPATAYAAYSSAVPSSYGAAAYSGYSTTDQMTSSVGPGAVTNYSAAPAATAAAPTDYTAGAAYDTANAGQLARSYGQQQTAYHPYRR